MEQCVQKVPPLGEVRRFRGCFQGFVRKVRPGYVSIDGTVVQAHRKAAGAPGGTLRQGIGRSRGGLPGKVIALADALGQSVRFVILPGQAHDLPVVPKLLKGLSFGAVVGDRAFDADWPVSELDRRGAEAVIPPGKNRKEPRDHDREMYRWRHRTGTCLRNPGSSARWRRDMPGRMSASWRGFIRVRV